MLNKHLVLLSALLVILSGPFALASEEDMNHQQWTSGLIYERQDTFVALTEHTGEYGEVVLYVGRTVKNCDEWDLSFTVMDVVSTAPEALESELMNGQLRVDTFAIHDVEYQISFEENESYIFIEFIEFDEQEKILTEILSGERLRIKIAVNEKNYVLGFSLQGAQEAIQRSKLLCREHLHDREYFGISSMSNIDEQYEL